MKEKGRKDYAIRLIHPEGVFYYRYHTYTWLFMNDISKGRSGKVHQHIFVFSPEVSSRVRTWKTTKFTEKEIEQMISVLNGGGGRIGLSTGSGKRGYRTTDFTVVTAPHLIKRSQEELDTVTKLVTEGVNSQILNNALQNKIIDKKFRDSIGVIQNALCGIDFDALNIKSRVVLDVVDASYGFRLLKLKKLENL